VALCVLGFMLPSIAKANIPIDVFIFAGQSNMMRTGSAALLPAAFSEIQDGVLYNYWANARFWPKPYETNSWLPMKARGNRFGVELTFGQTITDSVPGANVGILKVAYNGTSLRRNWHPTLSVYPIIYPTLMARVTSGLQRLVDDGYTPHLAGFVWIQGEGDASTKGTAEDYDGQLANLLSTLREDLNAPDLPIIFNQLHVDADRAFTETLRQRQEVFNASEPLSTMLEISDLPLKSDSVHFESITQITLGQRLAAAYLQSQNLPVTIRGVELLSPSIPEPGGLAMSALVTLLLCRRSRGPQPRERVTWPAPR